MFFFVFPCYLSQQSQQKLNLLQKLGIKKQTNTISLHFTNMIVDVLRVVLTYCQINANCKPLKYEPVAYSSFPFRHGGDAG